ncbi:MAG: hypothetical protein NC131_06100 [Roseburia sp.]|nr:hypothetical protein [Roseburia sp.]
MNKLVEEEYRIPRKVREQLQDKLPVLKEAKRLLIFKDYKQAHQFIKVNLTWNLPRYRSSWKPIILAIASTDRILYHGHELMRYWLQAKKAKDEEAMAFYALGQRYRYLYQYCIWVRNQFSKL